MTYPEEPSIKERVTVMLQMANNINPVRTRFYQTCTFSTAAICCSGAVQGLPLGHCDTVVTQFKLFCMNYTRIRHYKKECAMSIKKL